MWWFRIALLCLPLMACDGFTPLYGPNNLDGQITVKAPNSPTEFIVTQELERRLGRGGAYQLDYTLSSKAESLIVTSEQVRQRYNILGTLRYSLSDAQGQVVASGQTRAFTSYSATGTTIATASAAQDAQRRLIVILSDQLVAQLTADLRQ